MNKNKLKMNRFGECILSDLNLFYYKIKTIHILVLDKKDKDDLGLVWNDLGLVIDYQFE